MISLRRCERGLSRTHINKVIQLYSPRAIKLYILQCRADNIVGFSLKLLASLNGRSLVKITPILLVETVEAVLELEDVVLLEVGVLSRELENVHRCGRVLGVGGRWKGEAVPSAVRTFVVMMLAVLGLG